MHAHTHTHLFCVDVMNARSPTQYFMLKKIKGESEGRQTKYTITLLEITIPSNHGKVNVQAKGIIALDTWNGEPMKSLEFQTTNHISSYCKQYIQLSCFF